MLGGAGVFVSVEGEGWSFLGVRNCVILAGSGRWLWALSMEVF